MKKLLLALGILALICSSPAMAARNADGAMLLHTNDACAYSLGWDYCGDTGPWSAPLPPTCDLLVTTSTKDPVNDVAIVWAVAAFADGSSPAVTGYQFGIYGDVPADWYTALGPCPTGTAIEVPDAGWPAPGTGTAVGAGQVIMAQMFKMYWFAASSPNGVGATMSTGNYVMGNGHAEFVDDSSPPQEDYVFRFGTMGWGVPGSKDCPAPPTTGACCFPDGHCEVLDQTVCTGQFMGVGTLCDPNPCEQPRAACCFPDGSCTDLLQTDCVAQNGIWEGYPNTCATFECPQPQPQACCFADGTCQDLLVEACTTAGGTPEGEGTSCDTFQCPQPQACCFEDGTCQNLQPDACTAAGGTPEGEGTTCDTYNCPPPVATKVTTWGSIKGQYR